MFSKALAMRMALDDERLHDFIVSFKEECDNQSNRIFSVYLAVYQRDPECDEVARLLPQYRAVGEGEYDSVDKAISRQLMCDLEFHDVLKKRIKYQYLELKNSEISASLLYKVLQTCIGSSERVSHMDQVNELVRQVIVRAMPK